MSEKTDRWHDQQTAGDGPECGYDAAQERRIAELEGALRVVSMGLLVIHSKRLDRFVNWTPDTDDVLDRLRETVRVALQASAPRQPDRVCDTDQAHDEDQDARATGPSFEQERRCRELDEESGSRHGFA